MKRRPHGGHEFAEKPPLLSSNTPSVVVPERFDTLPDDFKGEWIRRRIFECARTEVDDEPRRLLFGIARDVLTNEIRTNYVAITGFSLENSVCLVGIEDEACPDRLRSLKGKLPVLGETAGLGDLCTRRSKRWSNPRDRDTVHGEVRVPIRAADGYWPHIETMLATWTWI